MEAQERDVLLNKLQVLTGIFESFERAYNRVVSLPSQKRATIDEIEKLPTSVNVVGTTAIGCGSYAIMFIPSLIVTSLIFTIISSVIRPFGGSVPNWMIWAMIPLIFVIDIFATRFVTKLVKRKGKDAINQKIRNNNQEVFWHNRDVDSQIAAAEYECQILREKVAQMDLSWYPPDYMFSDASKSFYKSIRNGICQTLGEAVKYYEEQLYRNQVLANQQKQINLAFTQCILQSMTISAIYSEGAATRQTIQQEGAATRQTIQQEGAATRGTIEQQGQAAQDALDKVNDTLNNNRRGL